MGAGQTKVRAGDKEVSLAGLFFIFHPMARAVHASHQSALSGLGESPMELWLIVGAAVVITLGVLAFIYASVFIRKRYIETEKHEEAAHQDESGGQGIRRPL